MQLNNDNNKSDNNVGNEFALNINKAKLINQNNNENNDNGNDKLSNQGNDNFGSGSKKLLVLRLVPEQNKRRETFSG